MPMTEADLSQNESQKEAALRRFFTEHPHVALAFSGGVDSGYLLWAASRWAREVRPLYVSTAFQPAWELADARRLSRELELKLDVIELDIFRCAEAAANGPRRCYYCKRAIFSALWEQARAAGCPVLLDGNNASDDADGRPGMQACRELGVLSPLRECGLTKGDVRRLSRRAGLFTWDKPSYSCLATRVACGQTLTRELLRRVEQGENALTELGFRDFRLRVQGDTALLQVTAAQQAKARTDWENIRRALAGLFPVLSLDEQARKESL